MGTRHDSKTGGRRLELQNEEMYSSHRLSAG